MEDIDYSNFTSVLNGFKKLFNLNSSPAPTLPSQLILVGGKKKIGISAQRVANKIISRQSEAGIPIGELPDGAVNPNEVMERIRAEEYFNEMITNMKLTVVIPAGTKLTGSGSAGAVPVQIIGQTITITTGFGQIQ